MNAERQALTDAAREWDARCPAAPVSLFACRFPGRYREAADALRLVRSQARHEEAPHAELAGAEIPTNQPVVGAVAAGRHDEERAS